MQRRQIRQAGYSWRCFSGDHQGTELRDRWLPDDGILKLLNERYSFEGPMKIDQSILNKAIDSKAPLSGFTSSENQSGIFSDDRRLQLHGNTKERHTFYYVTKPGQNCSSLPSNRDETDWTQLYKESSDHVESLLKKDKTESATRKRNNREPWDQIDSRLLDIHSMHRAKESPPSSFVCDYWDDKRLKSLFKPRDGESVEETLEWRIERFELVMNNKKEGKDKGYALVLPGGDDGECYSTEEIDELKRKSMFLRRAYMIALKKMPLGWSWTHCCEEAVELLKENMGFK